MAPPEASRMDYYRDFFLSMVGLACGRLYSTLHPQHEDLTGRVAIVTGANSGIGLQITLELLRQKATVYLACRNSSKTQEAIAHITSLVPNCVDRVKPLLLDTSSLSSVRECANQWSTIKSEIDILVHNAGIASTPPGQLLTSDDFPIMYATNLLGSFLMTHLLEPYLSDRARIIFTSSTGQYLSGFTSDFSLNVVKSRLEPGFHAPNAAVKRDGDAADTATYGNTKAMQIILVKLLQRRWDTLARRSGKANRRIVHAYTPGYTTTPIVAKLRPRAFWEDIPFWGLIVTTYLATDVSQGAATGVWLATTKDEAVIGENSGGAYWDRMARRVSSVDFMNIEMLERFWIRWEADAGIAWR